MLDITPLGHRVLVKLEKVYTGAIELPVETRLRHEKGTQKATVLALGRTAFRAFDDGMPWCKIGDKIIVPQYCGHDEVDPVTKDIYRIINDEDVIARFNSGDLSE